MPILTTLMLIGMGCAAKAPSLSPTSAPQPQSVHVHTLTVELKSGVTTVDLYYLATAQARPLVVVAHLVSSPPAGLEWPTDWKAELMCGKSSEERRAAFVKHALEELKAALAPGRP